MLVARGVSQSGQTASPPHSASGSESRKKPLNQRAAEVLEWFESLHAKPASANRSLPVLSVILRQAEVYGYRPEDSNPCKDIKRYRRRARERFLSPEEIRRVVEVLNRHDGTRPFQASVIRLLLLTGCRKGELLTLK